MTFMRACTGRVLTIRAMVFLTKEHRENVFTQSSETDGFLRAKPLLREWSYGWTMMNFAAMSARDSALRQSVQTAMKEAMENPRNFAVTKGMTIMDYAAINGHAAVVDYLGYLEAKSSGTPGLQGLGFARSNWGEAPVQKAITLGHLEAVEAFINKYTCSILEARSEGGETVLHNAVGAGSARILKLLKERCPGEYASKLRDRTKLDPKRYLWTEETPCLMSQTVLGIINNLEFGRDRKVVCVCACVHACVRAHACVWGAVRSACERTVV
jgi:hypothetical protein